jgi:hypothetical protein
MNGRCCPRAKRTPHNQAFLFRERLTSLERSDALVEFLAGGIHDIEKRIERKLADDTTDERLLTIPGVGAITF